MEHRIEYSNGLYYIGEVKFGKRHGNGKMVWPDGRTFEGVFSEDYPVKGKHVWPNNSWYDGTWKQWKRDGYGAMHYKDGTEYVGEWKDDKRNGNGRMHWLDGRSFNGVFSDDFPTKGKHIWPEPDGCWYDGTWKQWNRDGNGRMRWSDGRTFNGTFRDDFPTKGKHIWPDGSWYEGTWKQWKRDGYGAIRYQDGIEYVGEFKDEKRNGNGRMRWPDGRTFNGTFRDDFPTKGKHIWPDGSWYEGTFEKWNRHGYGTMHYQDGVEYVGEWARDTRNGRGALTRPDGTVTKGVWQDDQFLTRSGHGTQGRSTQSAATQEKAQTATPQPDKTTRASDAGLSALLSTGRYLTDESDRDDAVYPKALQKHFYALVGMKSVKQVIAGLYNRFLYDRNREQMLGQTPEKRGYNFVITGNPGTGKTTVARMIAALLNEIGILPENKLVETDRSGMVSDVIGGTAKLTTAVINRARGGTLFIDEAYSLYVEQSGNDFGTEAVNTLLKDMEDHRGEYAVILAGYSDEMNNMMRKANPGFVSRFDHIIHIPDYSAEEMLQIVVKRALQENYVIEKDAANRILREIREKMLDIHFDNGRCARKLLERAKDNLAARVVGIAHPRKEDFQILKAEDFGVQEETGDQLADYLQELDNMVGLESVKAQMHRLIDSVRVKKELEARNLPGSAIGSLNLCFTGNPGTGKTTVARLLGKIYYELGLLRKKDCFIECTRADLVGSYQGQTAPKVKDRVEQALGGILFIDEAYSLLNSDSDSFGMEAINTLVPLIENHRENLVVILAGYTDEMARFMDANPGLTSRISHTIEFPDYSIPEMAEIFLRNAKRSGYRVACEREQLEQFIRKKKETSKDFGNGRGIRNLLEEVISNLQHRITRQDLSALSDSAITTIRGEDLL